MSSLATRSVTPDQPQRENALHPARSVLVQAPAGSGKTDLLARRFLRLLADVDSPAQIVAITFTKAAAAEMRHRILNELEKAGQCPTPPDAEDEFSMESLAHRALARSRALGWNLVELPAQLRVSTIDSFCRELALQQPLLSGLGGGLEICEQPRDLYRRAARGTLERVDSADPELQQAIRGLLDWRDNDWQGLESLLVEMLSKRDRWMHYFVLGKHQDWDAVRERLERPFTNAVREGLTALSRLLDRVPGAREEALALARFACGKRNGALHRELAELAEFPEPPFANAAALEDARQACACLAALLLTSGAFRRRVNTRHGFPADCRREKERLLRLIASLDAVPGLQFALAEAAALPPARYTDDDWRIVCACFTVLRAAAAQLKVVFAETGAVDFIEVAQTADAVLHADDGLPAEAAFAPVDDVRHLLVDEFQDTSRRQHQLLAALIAAWPDRQDRTCFVVGDPMQSIYFFRDADTELFSRVQMTGLDAHNAEPLLFDRVQLSANFRTTPPLVTELNHFFGQVFAGDDGSGIEFSPASPARATGDHTRPSFRLHLSFVPQATKARIAEREAARAGQIQEIVALIREHMERSAAARAIGGKYRIAVLGRTRKALAPIAEALRNEAIPFRAVDLEPLRDRPEVLDALTLARALLNPHDRLAWLGVLRAPWCGLSLADLHTLAGDDDPALLARPVPELLAERIHHIGEDGRKAAERVLNAANSAPALRFARPAASLGAWLQQVWTRLGGEACSDATACANLDLLWNCLDRLPNGEQDLLGPALDAALNSLTALPDPDASADCGVQLMTIHKSKGLEFEVVIVPELQARDGRPEVKLLSWLERGLAEPDDSGEITEFLVAPIQPKGADRGRAKEWVDRVYRRREVQEMRRILYVAATRAREELHFFARPAYAEQKDGSLEIAKPAGTLLATAWPALGAEVESTFSDWLAVRSASQSEPDTIPALAAGAEGNLAVMPAPPKPAILRRLPADYKPPCDNSSPEITDQCAIETAGPKTPAAGATSGGSVAQLYSRHEGGPLSRAMGDAVHMLLEQLARLRIAMEWDAARAALRALEPRVAAEVRALGLSPRQAQETAALAMSLALDASADPAGAWILSPHPQAASEIGWNGMVAGMLRSVRVDRVFQAGLTPCTDGDNCWWIVDYKTAHSENLTTEAALPNLRPHFAAQLEAYAEVLRKLHPDGRPIRVALYYPRLRALDWWEPEN